MLRVTTLGTVGVHQAELPLPNLPLQPRRFALLVYLAIERDITREAVLSLFWGDQEPVRGRHALRQMLYELRKVLGEDWLEIDKERLVIGHVQVDASEFEEAVASNDVDRALSLYRGPFLAGFSLRSSAFESWADRKRAALGTAYRRLQREHIKELAGTGRFEDAVAAARLWVAADPLDDEAVHTLLERLAGAGRRAEALKYYEDFEKQLEAELQVEPIDETRELIERIRRGEHVQGVPLRPPQPTILTPSEQPAAIEVGGEPPGDSAPVADDVVSMPASSDPALSRPYPPARPRPRLVVTRAHMTGAFALALLLTILALVTRPGQRAAPSEEAEATIAVRSFEDHTSTAELTPLANALTEHVAHALAQSQALDVITPNGISYLRERGTPEDSIGLALGADFVVSGSLSREDDWVRVEVALLDGVTGKVVRTTFVDRPWTESRVLVEDVVSRVATFLRREVGDWVVVQQVRSQTPSEEAWRMLIEARSLQVGLARLARNKEFEALDRELSRADSMLAAAAKVDPAWTEPLIQGGWGMERRAFYARLRAPDDVATYRSIVERGVEMADRALVRDPRSAAAHELRGVLLHDLALRGGTPADSLFARLERAEAELRLAKDLDPTRQTAWRRLADLLSSTGRWGEAKNAAERAYQLDPYAPEANALVNTLYETSLEVGEDDAAEAWCTEGRRRFVNETPFLYCLLALHAWADAVKPDPALLRQEIDAFQKVHLAIQATLPPRLDALVATAYARAGQPDSARAILEKLGASPDPALLWMRAGGYAALGDQNTAIDLLASFLELNQRFSTRVARARAFWRLRDNADYQALLSAHDPG